MSGKKKKKTDRGRVEVMEPWFKDGLELSTGGRYAEITITPQMATFLLQGNEGNRAMRMRDAEAWATAMRNGEWKVGPQMIIDENGNLLDGQHRLEAIILTNKAQNFLVLFGVDPTLFEVVDIGAKRTTAVMLAHRGEKDCTTLGAVLTLIAKFQISPTFSSEVERQKVCSPTALILLLSRQPGARTSVSAVKGGRNLLSRSHIAFAHWLFNRIDPEAADKFIEDFCEGSNLSAGDPVLALRNMIVNYKMEQRRITRKESLAMLIKCWNFRRENKAIIGNKNSHLLSFKANDPFPKIDGFEYV